MKLLSLFLIVLGAPLAAQDLLARCDALTAKIEAPGNLPDPDGLRTAAMGVSITTIREACGQALALECAVGPEPEACLTRHTAAVDARIEALVERLQDHWDSGFQDEPRIAEILAVTPAERAADRTEGCARNTSNAQATAGALGLDLDAICQFEAAVAQWGGLAFTVAILDQANPEGAGGLTRSFLEQPGMVWVSDDVPLAVKEGLMIPLIPYVTFEGGAFESGFFSVLPYISDAACEQPFECDNRTAQGANRRGGYTLAGGRITTDAPVLGDWHFDREEVIVQASAVFPGGSQLASRDGDVLVLNGPAGERRFHALPAAEARDALNLAVSFEVPASLTYACTFRALQAIKAKPEGDLTEDERAILASAHYAREIMPYDHITDLQNPDGFGRQNPPSPSELEEYYQARAIAFGSRVEFSMTMQEIDPGSPEPLQVITDLPQDQIDRIALIQDSVLESAPDPEAARTEIDRLSAHIPLAAYAAARVRQTDGDYSDSYLAFVCGS